MHTTLENPSSNPGTVLRPFRIGANVAMVAAGFIAPVMLVLADKDLGKEEVHILEIPGLSRILADPVRPRGAKTLEPRRHSSFT